ncbi:alpha/beta hydrolase [Nakamurella flava]|uniref:Alpha/beta hydrolase n=1 Tax=Nakamurella flava TaxID=2576308 RepID=A0A4U6QE67_9ACTN|nr:alpha/beta hydrolase [Nakamurella flava]TKV58338.1 alpha/beta hydrolase [Nakamurella flava]
MSAQPPSARYADTPTRTVDAGGISYAYRALGPTGEVPVVFLVHLAANLDNWDPAVIDAVARKRHVITVDTRGVGATTGRVPGTVEEMADDAATFIRALGHDEVDVVGLSLGGMVAQALALTHPTVIRRLVLAGTGPRGGAGIDKVARVTFLDMLRAAVTRSDPKEFLFFHRDPAGRQAARAFLGRLGQRTENRDRAVSVAAFLTQLAAVRRWGRGTSVDLTRLRQPTMIVNGDDDRMVPTALSHDLHRRIPGSALLIYPHSGHTAMFQFPQRFAADLEEFLG